MRSLVSILVADVPRRAHLLRVLPMIAWMAVIFAMSAQSQVPEAPGLGAEFTAIAGHAIAYGVLALLILFAISSWWAVSSKTVLIAILLTVAYGVSDEFHQSFVPGRDPSAIDLVIDAIGATVASLIYWLVATAERWRR